MGCGELERPEGGEGAGRRGELGGLGGRLPHTEKPSQTIQLAWWKVDFRVSGEVTGTWPNSIPERLNAQVPNSLGQETELQTRIEMEQVGGAQRPEHFGKATLDTLVSQILFGTSRWSCSMRRKEPVVSTELPLFCFGPGGTPRLCQQKNLIVFLQGFTVCFGSLL